MVPWEVSFLIVFKIMLEETMAVELKVSCTLSLKGL